jgi:hypothetical protein
MKEDNGKIVAAAESGIFIIPFLQEKLPNCLKQTVYEVKVSAFDYNPQNKIGLVGYQNGSLDVHSGWDYLCC